MSGRSVYFARALTRALRLAPAPPAAASGTNGPHRSAALRIGEQRDLPEALACRSQQALKHTALRHSGAYTPQRRCASILGQTHCTAARGLAAPARFSDTAVGTACCGLCRGMLGRRGQPGHRTAHAGRGQLESGAKTRQCGSDQTRMRQARDRARYDRPNREQQTNKQHNAHRA